MKKIVWLNKSNEQLCVTIPKNSGVKEGDIVSIEKKKINRIVYSPVIGDLFNYGHLRLLNNANKLGDFHICGILTDKAARLYNKKPIANLKERMAIFSAIRSVDMVIVQESNDPTENLKKIHKEFKHAELLLIQGTNLKKVLGRKYIEQIGGELIQPPFYEKLSRKNIINKILKTYKER